MTLHQAFVALSKGFRVTRRGWSGYPVFCELEGQSIMREEFGSRRPWIPARRDCLATDWMHHYDPYEAA